MSKRLKAKLTAKLKKNKPVLPNPGQAGLLTERIVIEVRKKKESEKVDEKRKNEKD